MSENNENIIKSAFPFSDIQGIVPKEEQDSSGKYIKIWRIGTNEKQLTKKVDQKNLPIAIQEEYETYGTENKRRLIKRTFYKKLNESNESSNTAYSEVFQYKNLDVPTPEESGISKLIDSKGKTIGYRYYRNGINNSPIDSNNFVTIVEYSDGQYHPIQGTGNYEGDLEIIHSIFRENYKEGAGYEISGNRQKTLGISAIAKHSSQNIYVFSPGEQLKDDYYLANKERKKSITTNSATNEKSIHTPTCFNTEKYCRSKGASECKLSKFKSILLNNKEILNSNNKIILFPLSFASHATLYLINNKSNSTTQHLIDFSLSHCEKNKDGTAVSVNRDYFDKDTDNITLLNKFPMQINGTCSFYADAILSVIANPSNGYDSMENIVEDCGNGTMWLKVMAEMGKTFDMDQNYPTVKKFSDKAEALDFSNTNKYVVFNKNETFFGISKECYNNKFVDMKALIKCLQTNQQTNVITSLDDINGEPLEQKLSKQIKLQKEIIKAQKIIHSLNKCTKEFDKLCKNLDKKINEKKLSSRKDYPDYNDYSKINSRCKNFKEKYKDDLDNFIKHLSSIKKDKLEKEESQKLLDEVKNIENIRRIIDNEFYETFKRSNKEFLNKIKFSVVDSLSYELSGNQESQDVSEQSEISNESLSLQKINETAKKIDHEPLDIKNFQSKEISKTTMVALKANKKSSSQPPPSKHLSFTQRENLRRQQSGSAPARLGY